MSGAGSVSSNAVGQEDLDLSGDEALYLRWARDIGFDLEVRAPNVDTDKEGEYVPAVRSQVDEWFDEFYVPVIDALWNKYVPKSGACTVLQGEMSRCIGRLEGEYLKNGMMNMGDGYYDQMVDKVKDTVLKDGKFSSLVQNVMEMDALIVKGADYAKIVNSSFFQATDVEESINRMKMVVAAWCVANQDPIDFVPGHND